MKNIIFFLTLYALFNSELLNAQSIQAHYTSKADLVESLWQKGEAQWKSELTQSLGIPNSELEIFLKDKHTVFFKDRGAFFESFAKGLMTSTNAENFFLKLKEKYLELYQDKSSTVDNINSNNPLPVPQITCNPPCYNVNFQAGSLLGWDAYYAVSGTTGLTGKTGGSAGAVTQSGGPNPNTSNSYHVQLKTTPGTDPIAGTLIPYTPPLGGISAMVGDGPNYNYGAGILEQTFLVDISSPILTIQYAVVLEDPGSNHALSEKPYFKIEVLDTAGNPISQCGQYAVTAGPGLPGFKAFYYAPQGDTVYCKPWTTAFVPLNNYIGQCITVRFTTADCAQGGHFGYAYVAASCSRIDLSASTTFFCNGQQSVTLTGPAGASSYKWSTIGGCISGSTTQQILKITCAGTYSLIAQSSAGLQCLDTFSVIIPMSNAGPPPTTCFTATRVCSGSPTQFNGSCSTPGVKYYWDFYNTGQINDSSGANPSFTFSSGGNYPVRLHTVSPNGCSSDTIINVPVDTSSTSVAPTVLTNIISPTSCTNCNGKLEFTISGNPSNGDVLTTSFDNTVVTWTAIPIFGFINPSASPAGANFDSLINSSSIPPSNATIYFSKLCPGVYYIYYKPSAISGGSNVCANWSSIDTTIVVINSPGAITPILRISNDTIYSTSASTYQWYFNGLPIPGAVDSFYVTNQSGTYNVFTTDGNGCGKLSNDALYVGVSSLENETHLMVYPNPAGNALWIECSNLSFSKGNVTVEIFNILGEKVFYANPKTLNSQPKTVIDISALAKGIYILQLNAGNKIFRTKVVKE